MRGSLTPSGCRTASPRTALAGSPFGGAFARAFAEGLYFETSLAVKDLDLATKAAKLPATEAVLGCYRQVAEAGGDIAEAAARIRTL